MQSVPSQGSLRLVCCVDRLAKMGSVVAANSLLFVFTTAGFTICDFHFCLRQDIRAQLDRVYVQLVACELGTTAAAAVLSYKQRRSKQFFQSSVAVSSLLFPLLSSPIVTPARAPCVPARRESLTQHETRRQGKISLKHHLPECRLTLLLISRGNSLPAVKESKALTSTLPSHG
jgi:hypothetical protein